MKIKLSKNQWQQIGMRNGWTKKAQFFYNQNLLDTIEEIESLSHRQQELCKKLRKWVNPDWSWDQTESTVNDEFNALKQTIQEMDNTVNVVLANVLKDWWFDPEAWKESRNLSKQEGEKPAIEQEVK